MVVILEPWLELNPVQEQEQEQQQVQVPVQVPMLVLVLMLVPMLVREEQQQRWGLFLG